MESDGDRGLEALADIILSAQGSDEDVAQEVYEWLGTNRRLVQIKAAIGTDIEINSMNPFA